MGRITPFSPWVGVFPVGGAIFAAKPDVKHDRRPGFPQFPAFMARRRGRKCRPHGKNAAPTDASRPRREDNKRVNLARISWLATVLICMIAVLILLLQGYLGYAAVTFAVAVAAALNLF
jgi:hypothetical protein